MKTLALFSVLTAIQLSRSSSSLHESDSTATIDASGEATLAPDADAEDDAKEEPCEPTTFLHGKLSSCETFAITTLTSPRRCIHIDAPPPPSDDDTDLPVVCTNHKNWFDGTNNCDGYRHNPDWCVEYGDMDYRPHAHLTAKQACCACGGGIRSTPRLRVGDYVKLTGYDQYQDCHSLKIVEVRVNPVFHYRIKVMKPCGPKRYVTDPRTGARRVEGMVQPGTVINISSDDHNVISKHTKIELKKCRPGKPEQEFTLFPAGESGESDIVFISHESVGPLSTALGGKNHIFNVTQVFEDGLFEGSGDFFYLKVITNLNEGAFQADGSPYPPDLSYLASGHFGEKEYSEVKALSLRSKRGFDEQEFSMWQFRPFVKGESDDDSLAIDEHSQWLVRMTQLIGIDYLEQLPPWHLLDVERDASKGDVKSRFRELSRSFHPDKLVNQSEKKDLFERIFVLLQNAYQGLKSANEREKEAFRVQAEAGSQLFAHSQYIVELLPFHWTKIENDGGDEGDSSEKGTGRYILNAASHLNSTLLNGTFPEDEVEPSVQIWVTFMYSARCGMSKTVMGMVDLAARHLEYHENIKVGAYGCGLYKEHAPKPNDPTGVTSDPICAQFQRRETPNVHIIVETLPGRRRDENGMMVEVPLDPELVKENAQFKYFYADVPHGNTTQFYPHNFIDFAIKGKRVWESNHLVRRMTRMDFEEEDFIGNTSIVAYFDGTGSLEGADEVIDSIKNSLPGVARRFLKDDVYVGIAHCGYGDEFMDQVDTQSHVDCSKLDVAWLPDIKIYGANSTNGVSLLRGKFGDMRDVQIALESMSNVLRTLVGGTDGDDEDEFEEMQEENDPGDAGGSCDMKQTPPPPPDYDLDLDEIEGRMEEAPQLGLNTEKEASSETEPALESESKPALGEGPEKAPKKPTMPKLATDSDRPQLAGGRENKVRDRISGFHKRETRRSGGGQILGGGSGGSAGFISG
mmetsp:Transcript_17535/g.37043  ORF Transcript_17535/g.37043 Transcript_17535/m.37043 type:complete len:969 (-) Transcript_17535:411-3317(-)|eukprot:CAMPEP_0183714450 /NCGR_PEP_ID=MMETSP0737-20130205/8955_1 /TAXON_ID=385413 /ORGANISM="Thalassiosira miniscula, Strain CCMP1093" /LENGTH=968 /DNA_ID=CAMNT_0025943377 /DNA_START=245 /DNA_END=3151 /DNA_ORIENTATION=+